MCGGCLHNEIGLVNDCLENLFKGLKRQKLEPVCQLIKTFLDSAKSDGGLGCTPAQYHGGQYNGRDRDTLKLKVEFNVCNMQVRMPSKSSPTVMPYLRKFQLNFQEKMTTEDCSRHSA